MFECRDKLISLHLAIESVEEDVINQDKKYCKKCLHLVNDHTSDRLTYCPELS